MSYPDTITRLESQIAQLQDARVEEARERDRLRANHKDVVETKRGTDARLKSALAGLQQIYTLCAALPENYEPEATLRSIHKIAGDTFEIATTNLPRDLWQEASALSPSHQGTEP